MTPGVDTTLQQGEVLWRDLPEYVAAGLMRAFEPASEFVCPHRDHGASCPPDAFD
jgi:hypothetical protein